MNTFLVITSINEPTEAVKKFSGLKNFKLIVVGDKKTPNDWNCENTTFLSIEKQKELNYEFTRYVPYNHYSRKMIGYLYAIKNSALNIIDTDDDNIPYNFFGFPEYENSYNITQPDLGFINIYSYFTDKKIWPRGLPLKKINQENVFFNGIEKKETKVGVWQGLANGDADVDAIYRLTSDKLVEFRDKEPIVLNDNTICPFNTQNTIIRKELFTLLYLPVFVTFRFTDILRGLVAQPIMQQAGYKLGFIKPTVLQKRNEHDYFDDFISEIPMYKFSEKVVNLTHQSIKNQNSISENLYVSYENLYKNEIVSKDEIFVLERWIEELEKY